MTSQLKAALGTGPIRGSIGQLNLDDVDVDNLEAAIHYAHHIGCKTVNASQLLATAQLVLRLRQVGHALQACSEWQRDVRCALLCVH